MAIVADVTVTGTVASFDRDGFPAVTVTLADSILTAVVSGIDVGSPGREPSTAELAAGIDALEPPTVSTDQGAHALVDLTMRATSAAVAAARGALSGPEDLVLRHRVAVATQAALRALDYEV